MFVVVEGFGRFVDEIELLLQRQPRGRQGWRRGGQVEVVEDPLDDPVITDEGEYDHGRATTRAGQCLDTEDTAQQLRPSEPPGPYRLVDRRRIDVVLGTRRFVGGNR